MNLSDPTTLIGVVVVVVIVAAAVYLWKAKSSGKPHLIKASNGKKALHRMGCFL